MWAGIWGALPAMAQTPVPNLAATVQAQRTANEPYRIGAGDVLDIRVFTWLSKSPWSVIPVTTFLAVYPISILPPVMLIAENWDTIKTVIKTALENYISSRKVI